MKILKHMVKLEVLAHHPDYSSGYWELFVEDYCEGDYETWRKNMIKEVKDYIGRYYWHTIEIFSVYTLKNHVYRTEETKTDEDRSMVF